MKYDLERVLIDSKDGVGFTLGDFLKSVLCLGVTGGGKTTAMRLLALALLRAQCGGIIFCAKKEERPFWVELITEAGRLADLVIFDQHGGEMNGVTGGVVFDPIAEQAARRSEGGGQIFNTVALLLQMADATNEGGGGDRGGGDSAFFKLQLKTFLTALVALAVASSQPVTLQRLRELAASAPHNLTELKTREWQERPMGRQLAQLAAGIDAAGDERQADLAETFAYWTETFPVFSDRPRSIVESMWNATVQPFLYSPLRQIFTGGRSTITPESCDQGRLIVIDIPVQDLQVTACVAAQIWSHCFRVAAMRRSGPRGSLRVWFRWLDECQNFIAKDGSDAAFQAISRSAAVGSVMLTQQISSLSEIIGEKATDNLVSNLTTKFITLSSGQTAEWVSNQLGERWVPVRSLSWNGNAQHTDGGASGQGSTGSTVSIKDELRRYLEPSVLQTLRNGGPANNFEVDTVMFSAGRTYGKPGEEQLPYKFLTFRQKR